ncbi:P-loop containing nucleoside triphosphate hydrolase protein [Auriscalpium vulgare]|uniref:P-loop containing nucleoside triphosphate hydrolase protein n=1 Tax=Auriscalpium vulgare TaxID=40419 RepID=A0ACB8RUU8_9AGAM|nr:P-loop containing nucleoside triphosphate hydrolase protein [Auriscalpium vulgare]
MRSFASSSKKTAHGPSGRSSRGHRSHKPSGLSKSGSTGFSNRGGRAPGLVLPTPSDPVNDADYIKKTYASATPLKKAWEDNPKSPLSNFMMTTVSRQPSYSYQEALINGKSGWRATIPVEIDGAAPILGIGDSQNKKDAEQLAALSALLQLHANGLLDTTKPQAPPSGPAALSNGSAITYERARQFMDYYCRRYNFGKPDITYNEVRGNRGRNSSWEAIMNVGGRRIGIGSGANKKLAQTNCYIDVTQYLESCDADLWKAFVEAAVTGKDLGMGPRVSFNMSEGLEDEVRDLCTDIRRSNLYQNRPDSTIASTLTSAGRTPVYRRPVSQEHLQAKSQRLSEQRDKYLEDPQLEKMRATRKSLPVYTRADEIMDHIRNNEVTICLAATGSGKTTQIPQLILDDYIARGQGASCNIVCTQPRRLAAISVADRVAKERGQVVGRGSIGYQVRFEAKLPEEHGSVTFCTTGIFLRRMQIALQEGSSGGGVNLDDVTHVVVDEVHERDVDTDLLLVVLKRLLADRKAKGKPIKVVLMSATIDPTLFQQYFPDETGAPAGIVEVPGRSFPVKKHFLEDFIPTLAKNPVARSVFADFAVSKYLHRELGMDADALMGGLSSRLPPSRSDRAPPDKGTDDDLELPYPLIALTIAHVLQQSDDGHVLVFLPGWDEIQSVNKLLLDNRFGLPFNDSSKYSIHLLHSTIPVLEQQVIFEPPPAGVRRIILSTNIAETSVTIPDVVYVVDTGKIKEQRYDPQRHMSSLISAWVGSSNLNQRAGRAGRHRPGEYFGILGQKRADELHPYQTVEMKRVDLTNVVMHVKALDFPGMAVEDVLAACIEPPASERIEAAMTDLKMVGAIDDSQNLTSLGRVLLQLPVEVQVGRLVLYGSFFRCLDQALTLAAILTNRDPFVSPMHLKTEAARQKDSWTHRDFRSDALATLEAYNAWWAMQGRGDYVQANRFCSDNFLSKPTLLMIERIKRHLLGSLQHAGVLDVSAGGKAEVLGRGKDIEVPHELNVNGHSQPLLAALIAIASQPKFAIRTGEKTYRTQQDKATFIHPSSVNHRRREVVTDVEDGIFVGKHIIAFAEKRQNISMAGSSGNAQMSLVTTTRLDPMTYVLFGAYRIAVTARGLECDDWLPIVGNVYALDDIQNLKTMIEGCMARVFEGLVMRKHRPRITAPVTSREEEESGDEDLEEKVQKKNYALTPTEVKELDYLTRDVVGILNRYADERMSSQSRNTSRSATPMGSPSYGSSRLPPMGSRSGQSTPYGMRSAYNSRPGTPSRLSRAF